jgi:hypothetical protein
MMEEKYPSATLLLETIQKEYNTEEARGQSIDIRSTSLLGFTGVLFVFVFNVYRSDLWLNLSWKMEILLFLLFVSAGFFAITIFTRKRKRLGLKPFEKRETIEDVSKDPKHEITIFLIESYKECLDVSIEANDSKIKWFKTSVLSLFVAIVWLLIVAVTR